MQQIKKIILHCSDSEWGTAISIDQYHRVVKGWSKIGYLGVILNGFVHPDIYWEFSDGAFEWGRPIDKDKFIEADEIEAQALGLNSTTVGICLIGKDKFTANQFLEAKERINRFLELWNLKPEDVLGHYEVDQHGKTCPNVDMKIFREFLTDDSKLNLLNLKAPVGP